MYICSFNECIIFRGKNFSCLVSVRLYCMDGPYPYLLNRGNQMLNPINNQEVLNQSFANKNLLFLSLPLTKPKTALIYLCPLWQVHNIQLLQLLQIQIRSPALLQAEQAKLLLSLLSLLTRERGCKTQLIDVTLPNLRGKCNPMA